jgi:hypothetical protein
MHVNIKRKDVYICENYSVGIRDFDYKSMKIIIFIWFIFWNNKFFVLKIAAIFLFFITQFTHTHTTRDNV